ncbi:MAG: putative Zn finger-like uncharacterized protein [Bradymonadia bacterium]|jgi:predicted Zn finger-like uncharacterized protein
MIARCPNCSSRLRVADGRVSPRSRIRCTKCETISRLSELHPDTPRNTAALSPVNPGSLRAQSSVTLVVADDGADVPVPDGNGVGAQTDKEHKQSTSTLGEHAFEEVPDVRDTLHIARPLGSVVAETPDAAKLRESAAPVRVAGFDEESALPPELLPANLPPRRGVGESSDTNFPVTSDKDEIPREPQALRRTKVAATRGLKHDGSTPTGLPSLEEFSNIEDEEDDIPDEVPTPELQTADGASTIEEEQANSNARTTAASAGRDEAATRVIDEMIGHDAAESQATGENAHSRDTPDHGGMFPDDGGMFPPTAAQVAGLDRLATTEDSFPIPLAAFDQPVFRSRKSASVQSVEGNTLSESQAGTTRNNESDALLLSDAEAFLSEALSGGQRNTMPESSGSVSTLDADAADFVQIAFDAAQNGLELQRASSAPSIGLDMRETMLVQPGDELELLTRNSAAHSMPGSGGSLTQDGVHARTTGFGTRSTPKDDDSDPFGVPAPHEAAIPGVRGPSGEHAASYGLAKIEGTVDPLVEFGEMFREARAGETGDPAATAALADIMLGDQFGGERAGKPAEELQLMGGSTTTAEQESPFWRERVSMPSNSPIRMSADTPSTRGPRHTDSTDAMLSEAMTASRHDKAPPAPKTTVKTVRRQRQTEELDGVGDGRKATYLLSTLLMTLLTLIGVAGFIAYKNDGFLDLREPDQMIGVAFKDQPYLPRFRTVLRAGDDGNEIEIPAADGGTPIGDHPLAVRDITSGYYTNAAGIEFVLLHGTIENQTEFGFRRLVVLAELVDSTGQVVRSRFVPAGQRVDQPALEDATTAADLNALYATISTSAEDLLIAPTNLTPFTAVFLVREGESVEGFTYRAEVQRGERQAASPWRGISFGTMPDVTD